MATYHGLIKTSCLVCGWETTDETTMEVLNDMNGECPKCENQFFRWQNEDGSIVVSLIKNQDGLYSHDTLTLLEEFQK